MKVLFTGVVHEPSWPGGEPRVARLLGRAFSAQGIQVAKCFLPRDRSRMESCEPWAAQSIINGRIVVQSARKGQRLLVPKIAKNG